MPGKNTIPAEEQGILETIILKNGETCQIKKLTSENAKQSWELQKAIMYNLGPEKAQFILEKTEDEIKNTLSKSNDITLGAFVDDKLIAQQTLHLHGECTEHKPVHPNKVKLSGTSAEIGGAMVYPEKYRGNGLTEKMGMLLQKEAENMEISYLTSEVHVENPWSYNVFLKMGFFIGNALLSPDDGAPIVVLFKPLHQKAVFDHCDKIKELSDGLKIEAAKAHIAGGYYATGCQYDKEAKTFNLSFDKLKFMVSLPNKGVEHGQVL